MLITIARAAEEISADESAILRAIDQGLLSEGRFDDGTAGVYEAQLFALERMDTSGRRWDASARSTALDALSGSGSEAAAELLRGLTLAELAGRIIAGRAAFFVAGVAQQHVIGSAVAEDMGLGGYGVSVVVATDAEDAARALGLAEHIEGNVIAVDGRDEHRAALEALALYVYGGSREQIAAEHWLTRKLDDATGGRAA